MLLALRPLSVVTDEFHRQAKSDETLHCQSTKLIDATCLMSQAIYKTNILRVSNKLKILRVQVNLVIFGCCLSIDYACLNLLRSFAKIIEHILVAICIMNIIDCAVEANSIFCSGQKICSTAAQ